MKTNNILIILALIAVLGIAIAERSMGDTNARLDRLNWRLDRVKLWIDRGNNLISEMDSRGHDTSEMRSILDRVQNNVESVETAIATGDPATVRQTLSEIREKRLHSLANFKIAQFSQYLDRLEIEDVDKKHTREINSIRDKVDAARELATPSRKYSPGEGRMVFHYLRDAALEMRGLAEKMRSKVL